MNYKIYKFLLFFGLVVFSLTSCREDQEVAEIVDPSTKAVATITADRAVTGSISEGDTIVFDVELSKAVSLDNIAFTVEIMDDSEASEADVAVVESVINTFEKTGQVTVVVLADDLPEATETLKFRVGSFDLEENWQLAPSSDVVEVDLTVNNVNKADVLTIAMEWTDPADDYDMYIYLGGSLAALGATGNMPEIDATNFSLAGYPDGEYTFAIDPFALENEVTEYVLRFGYGDTVEVIEGTFDVNNADDLFDEDLGYYVLATFNKSGSSFTFTSN